MRNLTKASRDASRAAQFESLIKNGYTQETYKGLDFFTKQDGQYFTLEVYRGNAANHEEYRNYRTEERRAEIIQNYKNNYDSREQYKAEQKIKNKGKSSSHAAAAAAIKTELKTAFPNIKFSVTSDSFSGGNAVRISWEDGATVAEVEEITSKYQYGHFNGMEDIYEYTNSREDIPQVKYVTESRSMSEKSENILKPLAEQLFNSFGDGDHYNCRGASQFLREIFYNTSFLNVGVPLAIVPTGETCGINTPELFYKIQFGKTEHHNEVETVIIPSNSVSIVEYGKGIAVIGNTKPIKDALKALGGKFNFRLTVGAGWVFPLSKFDDLKELLSGCSKPTEIPVPSFNFFDEVEKLITNN